MRKNTGKMYFGRRILHEKHRNRFLMQNSLFLRDVKWSSFEKCRDVVNVEACKMG
jgi:hypothetical protein